jgi:flagellar hook-associated protein 3 FlgL
MRVNPNITPDLLAALAQTQQQENTALLQLSSGRRVSQPSDDPSAAAVLVQNAADTSQNSQNQSSVSEVQGQLQMADSTLSSVVTTLERAISLGVEGANGTLSDSDRTAIINELQGIQSQLISVANLTYEGEPVFAGTASGATPFVADASQPSGVRYNGNNGTNQVSFGDGFKMQVNLPGSQIFMNASGNVFQSLQDLITALQTNTDAGTAVTNLRTAYDTVTAQRVFYGNGSNQLQSQQTYLSNESLQLSQQENTLAAADMTTAASNLVNAQAAENATLTAIGRISQTNLFDFLK